MDDITKNTLICHITVKIAVELKTRGIEIKYQDAKQIACGILGIIIESTSDEPR